MICSLCGGEVIWMGPLTALTHTQCKSCGGTDCQEVEDYYDDRDDEEALADAYEGYLTAMEIISEDK